ncbi:hypothetical protein DL546_000616 [Coniochaeta pulveracea]|uniref:Uncharacterized protein n=1 Tax=Coniochaeta pulveracea TaxID=177199 RepID=A0A420XX43_9PEZI|nr:hypothetical protein DL546_000616 [Coniochaeta pulveracea]
MALKFSIMNGANGNGVNGNGVNNFVTAADVLSDSDLSDNQFNGAPVNAAPVNAAPINAAPINAAPVNAAPVNAAPVNAAPGNGASGDDYAVRPPYVYPHGREELLLHRILSRHGIPWGRHSTAERMFLVIHPQVPALVSPGTTPADGPFPPVVPELPGGDADLEAEYDEERSDQYAMEFLEAWRNHPAMQEAKERLGLRQTLRFLSLGMYAYEQLNGLTPLANFQTRDWFKRTLEHIEVAWNGATV